MESMHGLGCRLSKQFLPSQEKNKDTDTLGQFSIQIDNPHTTPK